MDPHAITDRDAAPSPSKNLAPPKVWALPESGLAVFHGRADAPRLFHYFLPGLMALGKSVLCLDGANRFDPLLIARFARERGREASVFNRQLRVARAFTCFQMTELLVRVPRLLQAFPAQVVMVTAVPDLYFDEDVREREAVSSFYRALQALQAAERLPLSVGVFSDAASSRSPRRMLFQHLTAAAGHVFRFVEREDAGLVLTSEKPAPAACKALP
jgi:hypothetical protein